MNLSLSTCLQRDWESARALGDSVWRDTISSNLTPASRSGSAALVAGVDGSRVPEPKLGDSWFKSRLGTGLGFESQTFQVSESEPEPKLRHSKSRNRNRNRKSDILSLGMGTGIESQTFQVSESEPKSKFNVSRIFP